MVISLRVKHEGAKMTRVYSFLDGKVLLNDDAPYRSIKITPSWTQNMALTITFYFTLVTFLGVNGIPKGGFYDLSRPKKREIEYYEGA